MRCVRFASVFQFLIVGFFLGISRIEAEQTVSVTWDPSPDTRVTGYNFYFGEVGSGVTNRQAVGNSTMALLEGLSLGKSYFAFATAVGDGGLESDPSNVITYSPNSPPVLAPIPDQTVTVMNALVVGLSASDADLPAQTLSYRLVAGPAGSAITNGMFFWIPTGWQAPSTNLVTIEVADDGIPSLTAQTSFNVEAIPANAPPVLNSIASCTILTGTQFSTQLRATDPDLPAQTLTYKLLSGPGGATVDPVSGLFTWTPNRTQVGTALISVAVTDNGFPPLSASQSFTATVLLANTAPVLPVIPDQTIGEVAPFVLTLGATDPDLPAQSLTYSLVAGPEGASVDSGSGTFSWSPTELQGPSTNLVTVQVSDNGSPALGDTKSFTIIVNEVNTPPVLDPIPNQRVKAGSVLMLALSTTDADLPANELTYSLVSAPSGATVDPATGVFAWRLPKAIPSSTNLVTVSVSDGTDSDTKSFQVVVLGRGADGSSRWSALKQMDIRQLSWVAELDETRSVRFTHPLPSNTLSEQSLHFLEVSEDLVHWVRLSSISESSEVRDSDAVNVPVRFYRIQSEPGHSAAEDVEVSPE